MAHRPLPRIYRPARKSLIEGDPALEPVGIEVMKEHAVVADSDRDALIAGYIASAREEVEAMTNRALITQTRVYKIDRFPTSIQQLIELPGGTLQAVSSIQYVDADGATQTWAASNYIADAGPDLGLVGLAYQKTWPTIRQWDLPVTISYAVGYGDDPGDVPEKLRTAIQLIAADLFARREDSNSGTIITEIPMSARRLARSERIRPAF
jgi:uncharacterized phiE125 gp8 family phage protein